LSISQKAISKKEIQSQTWRKGFLKHAQIKSWKGLGVEENWGRLDAEQREGPLRTWGGDTHLPWEENCGAWKKKKRTSSSGDNWGMTGKG